MSCCRPRLCTMTTQQQGSVRVVPTSVTSHTLSIIIDAELNSSFNESNDTISIGKQQESSLTCTS